MKTPEISSTLYVELDCLLDTRLEIMRARLGDDKFEGLIRSGYFDRSDDSFEGCTPEQFYELYDKRDKSVLKRACVTPIVLFMNEFIRDKLVQGVVTPFKEVPKIVVNVHPYQLSQAEKEVIWGSVRAMTDHLVDVTIIDIPPEGITPGYVKQYYSIMVMYRGPQWIEIHAKNENFKKTSCPEVGLISPAIYSVSRQIGTVGDSSGYQDVERLGRVFVGLQLIPVSKFCAIIQR